PANILVCDSGRVLLSDFGLAVESREPTLTAVGTVIGTPQYMSPEQAMGLPLDGRADLYSVAVVLHEVLAGHSVYKGSRSADILRNVVETPLPPVRQLNPDISHALSDILEKALAKDPRARYSTANEFVRALRGTGLGAAIKPDVQYAAPAIRESD